MAVFLSGLMRFILVAGSLRFPGVFGFYEIFQIGKTSAPERTVLLDPGVDGSERFGIQVVDAVAAFAVFSYQMGATQEAQVLGNGWAGDGKGFGDLAGGLAAAAEEIEDGPARGIGKGLEGGFGGSGRGLGICNRTVPHNA
jgi:hypothetical protein